MLLVSTLRERDDVVMWSVHQRLGELWMIQKNRPLTEDEEKELCICLEANMRKAWKLAELKNLSLMASIVQDTEEQNRICKQIEEIYPYGRYAL